MSLQAPGLLPLGMTPKRLMWAAHLAGSTGPIIRPASSSLAKYSSMTDGLLRADGIFFFAGLSCVVALLKPIWNQNWIPSQTYLANAWSGWCWSRARHASRRSGDVAARGKGQVPFARVG